MCFFIVVEVVFYIFSDTQSHQALDEFFIAKPWSSILFLILFEKSICSCHIAKIELLTNSYPSPLLKGCLCFSKFKLIEFFSIIIQTFQLFFVIVENALNVVLLEYLFHQLFIQFLNLVFFLLPLKFLKNLLFELLLAFLFLFFLFAIFLLW